MIDENSLYNAPAAKCPILGNGGNDGNDSEATAKEPADFEVWNEGAAPTSNYRVTGRVYWLTKPCYDLGQDALAGTTWQWTNDGWIQVFGKFYLDD